MAETTPTTAPHDTKDEALQSVTNSGQPPKSRVDNADAAYNIYDKMKKNNETLAYNRSRIQAQQDGNAPYNRTQRRRLGLGWCANGNYGKSRATVRLNSTSIWNMFTSVSEFIQLVLRNKKDKDPEQPSADYGQIIAEEFTDTLLEDEDFYYSLMSRIKEMTTHGIGTVYWSDEYDWRSEAVKLGNILFPAKTKSKKRGLKIICIRDEIDPVDLFHKIGDGDPEKEAIASEEGWDVQHTKKVLIDAYTHGQSEYEEFSQSEWESIQTKIKNHDYEYDAEFEGVRIVHMLVTEIGGTVSHMIFYEQDPGQKTKEVTRRAFMFKKHGRFEHIGTAVHFLMFDIGNGYMASIRGLGYELFHTDDIANKMINNVVDGGALGSSLIVQPQSGNDIGKMMVTKMGPVTMVPPELSVVQSSFAPPIDKALQVIGLMAQLDNNNAGVYQTKADAVTQKARTATEIENESINEARFQTNQAAWYYVQWESWLAETFRRLVNKDYPSTSDGYDEHNDFIKRCLDRGVPRELLDFDKWKVKAVRAIGMGSAVQAVRQSEWLLNRMHMLDERGRVNAVRDAIQVRFGQSKADRYKPIQSRDLIDTRAHSIAALENNDLINAQQVVAGVDQPHKIHIMMHLEKMGQMARVIQESPGAVDMIQMRNFFQTALQHVIQHFEYLGQDPTRKADLNELKPLFEEMVQFAKLVANSAEQIEQQKVQQQQQQQQIVAQAKKTLEDRSLEIEMAKIASNERVEMAKTESLDRNRTAKTITQIETSNIKAMADMERKMMTAIADIQRDNAKLAAELQKMSLETEAGENVQ